MSLFGAIDISATGVDAMQTWIDANAGNIANANDVSSPGTTPYEAQLVEFSPASPTGESGVTVAVDEDDSPGIVAHEPGNPLADTNGDVVLPDIALGDQLVGLVQAEEGYQADTSAISRAITAYQQGMQIGS